MAATEEGEYRVCLSPSLPPREPVWPSGKALGW